VAVGDEVLGIDVDEDVAGAAELGGAGDDLAVAGLEEFGGLGLADDDGLVDALIGIHGLEELDDDAVDDGVGAAVAHLGLELLGAALEVAQLAEVGQLDGEVGDLQLAGVALRVLAQVVEVVDEPVGGDGAGGRDLDGVGDVGDEV
jgi:hypothetical protein